ncbi:hypothetical protein PISMIDRAFT_19938 [Pisolithus microcarpus 441]|uniref:Uncharacterized protein n=1 Tax=Pisolithus microcarpus 441 TaxID=765257 RepID=A0A0C9XF95_9AGAM|nr:hypothetical protein PISMIDRAFT_19938 [Pisolithus microcarpus 441]
MFQDGNYPSLSNNVSGAGWCFCAQNVGAATAYIDGIVSVGIQGYKLECCKVQKEAHLGKPRESFGVRYLLLDEGTSNITLMNEFRDQMLALTACCWLQLLREDVGQRYAKALQGVPRNQAYPPLMWSTQPEQRE